MHEVGGAVTRQNNNSHKHNITSETGIYHIKNNGTHRHPAAFHTRILKKMIRNHKVLRGRNDGFSVLIAVKNLPCCGESIEIASSTTYIEILMNTQ